MLRSPRISEGGTWAIQTEGVKCNPCRIRTISRLHVTDLTLMHHTCVKECLQVKDG